MKVYVHNLHLTNQCYPESFIDEGICQAQECDGSEFLARKHQKKSNDIFPFVHTYNQRNQIISPKIHQNK